MRIAGTLFWLCSVTVMAVILLGFIGRFHPAGDSFAAFRLHFGFAAVLFWGLSIIAGRVWVERLNGLAACIALGAILWSTQWPRPHEPQGGISVLQHNMLFRNRTVDAVIAQITASDADVVLLQEVLPAYHQQLQALPSYDEVHYCDRNAGMNNVILSKWPTLEFGCNGWANWAQLRTPVGPVTFVSLHLPWPWPDTQSAAVQRLGPVLARLPQPVIVAGDFNSAPWSNAVTQLAASTGTLPVPGLRLSFADPRFWPGLPIDHILMPTGWQGTATLVGAAGSDHRATLARIGPRAGG